MRERCFVIEMERREYHSGWLDLRRHPDKDDAEIMDEMLSAETLTFRGAADSAACTLPTTPDATAGARHSRGGRLGSGRTLGWAQVSSLGATRYSKRASRMFSSEAAWNGCREGHLSRVGGASPS